MKEVTVRGLSQLRFLKREITAERDRIIELRTLAGYGKRDLTREGRGNQTSDRTGTYAIEIAYLTDLVAKNMKRCICELLRLQQFLNSIEDSEMRTIFRERYIKGRSWLSIAFLLGYHDEQLPRRKHDRFLQSYNAQAARGCDCAKQVEKNCLATSKQKKREELR